jgi:FkbM family methyltransferase
VKFKPLLRALLHRAGYEVSRVQPPLRLRLLSDRAVAVVVDVGANKGQYAALMRNTGWKGPIISFEPLLGPHRILEIAASRDTLWTTHRLALGDSTGTLEMGAASTPGASSSLLPATELLTPSSGVTMDDRETVTVRRLDDVSLPGGTLYLKLDVQGYELSALKGAVATLKRAAIVEAELSIAELYEGQPLLPQVVSFLRSQGFVLIDLLPEFRDIRSGDLLQVNGLFVRPQQV